MYYEKDEDLMKMWEFKNMICKDKNLYNISYLELAVLLNRKEFVKYILDKKKAEKINMNSVCQNLIPLCFMMDNIEMLLLLNDYYKIDVNYCDKELKRFNALNIANHFCMKIDRYQKLNTIEKLKNMDENGRKTYLHNLWYNWGYYYSTVNLKSIYNDIDYFTLSIEELNMINELERTNKKELKNKCQNDLKRKCLLGDKPLYEDGSFEHLWFEYEYNKVLEKEISKSVDRHDYAIKILRELFSETQEDLEKILSFKFENPVQKVNPFVFSIMKAVYNKDFDSFKEYKKIYRKREEYKPLEELLIMMDNLEVVKRVVGENSVETFLKEREEELKSNLREHLKELRSRRINLENDNVFSKYSNILKNSDDHQKVFHRGQLRKDYERSENAFGFTPCDYVVNKLLYFYNTILGSKEEINQDLLVLLTNLRNSVCNIDRSKSVTFIKKDECIDEQIEKMLSMV